MVVWVYFIPSMTNGWWATAGEIWTILAWPQSLLKAWRQASPLLCLRKISFFRCSSGQSLCSRRFSPAPKSMSWDGSRGKWKFAGEFAPDLKYNCSSKCGEKLQITLKTLYIVLYLMFPSLWRWENLASFLLVVSLYVFFSFSGQIKVKLSSGSKNPGLLNQ